MTPKEIRTPTQEERDVSRRRKFWALAAAGVLATSGLAACGDDDDDGGEGGSGGGDSGGTPKVGVLLPDSQSSVRWETVDRPFLQKAFEAAGVDADIQNAEGDKSTQQQQAEQMITNGAKVLLLVNLDSGSGATIVSNAKAQNAKVIDYDRLTLEADSDYYVSFDNEAVGKLQGEGLVKCIEDRRLDTPNIAVLNGSPTDNNAKLFKNGYDSVINPKFESGEWKEVDDQSVPDWDNQQALTIFEQMLEKSNNEIDGVLAANDGLGQAAISALKSRKVENVPVTGQDATTEGVQNVLAGDQCMTVYKAIKKEADAASELAVALAKGETPSTATDSINNGKKDVPSVLLEPVAVTKDNVADTVIKDGFRTKEELCVGRFKADCEGL